jgi:serine/threonine protein kinase/WD40 repeat protein
VKGLLHGRGVNGAAARKSASRVADEETDLAIKKEATLSSYTLGPASLLEWVDTIADRFEQAWKSGPPPRIIDYLGDTIGEERTVLLRELAKIDLERRSKAGERCSWAEYLRMFPELAGEENDLLSIVTAEGKTLVAPPPSASQSLPPQGCFHSSQSLGLPSIEGFEILCEVGRGGMGTVYKARQMRLKRVVALKVLRAPVEADPKRRARFRTEAEATARLQHPNIAQLYEIGEQDGNPYLVIEYIEGGSLGDRLRGKPQPPRQAAELIASLARAMHYAHELGVVHRDLKPDNILLQPLGDDRKAEPKNSSTPILTTASYTPKITDFGLAKLLETESGLSLSGAVVGTPSYMAPEQAEGKSRMVGPSADIYALGAILYEMLTGRPPFQGDSLLDVLEQVRKGEPVPPSQLLPKLPRDMETICLKALAHAPNSRYVSAGALAEDLEHFVNGEPIQARPISRLERLVRWCRRRPAQAGMILMAVILTMTLVTSSLLIAMYSASREKIQRREALLNQLQLVRASDRLDGWSDQAWKLIREAAALREDASLRSLAAAACSDLDAQPRQSREWVGTSCVVFDDDGRRLLLGGKDDNRGRKMEGAKLWEIDSDRLTVSWRAGAGPVAFHGDGTPLQLSARGGSCLLLWNLQTQQLIREIRLQPSADPSAVSSLRKSVLGFPLLALSTRGKTGATAVTSDGRHTVMVWDAESGKTLFSFDRLATTLALSSTGNLLAVGDERGRVELWTVPGGEHLGTCQQSASPIHNVAFSPNGHRLAVADASRALTVWDVKQRMPLAHCRGTQYDIYALAFSGDGTLIASGGRGPSLLWDAATGKLLLGLHNSGTVTSLAFDPGRQRLAIGSQSPSRVSLWDLEGNRGIQTLRGLTCQASCVCFSADGKQLAALTANGLIALWDLKSGRLHRLVAAPNGNTDQAALAFSRTGRRFVCATDREAILWETATGKKLKSWTLPVGSRNLLVFPSSNSLLLFREEEENATEAGLALKHPGTYRARNLLDSSPLNSIFTIKDFNSSLLDASLTADGATLLLEGTRREGGSQRRLVRAYDARTGKERWSLTSTRTPMTGTLALDPAGHFVALRTDNRVNQATLVDVDSGTVIASLEPAPVCLGSEAKLLITYGSGSSRGKEHGYALCRRDHPSPCLVLGMDTMPSFRPAFSRDGRLLAWSNADGTVAVCDLPLLRKRFNEVGLFCEDLQP